MAGPIKGSIEHFFAGAGLLSGTAQSAFVNIYSFLNNNTGTLGIRRLAYHTGSKGTGMADTRGMNFYDQANPAGENAWACFGFMSASVPWYVLVQWTGGTAIGTAPGSPALFESSAATTHMFAVAFAQRVDGGNPWNGSSGSNGIDTKGTPVWHPGTSSLVVHPRSNDAVRGGSHGTSRQNLMGFSSLASTNYRMQLVADYDNIAIMFDSGADNSYAGIIFGQYVPLSGTNPQVPYVSIKDTTVPFTAGTQYGPSNGSSAQQGGIGYPDVSISGTCSSGNDRYGTTFFQTTLAQPNRAYGTPLYNEFPMLVGLNEQNNQVGATGQMGSFFCEVYNVSTHDTNGARTRAAFGTTTLASVKMTIPWNSGTVPGSGVNRAGVQF